MRIIVITSPLAVKDEATICNLLFDHGLEILHLRKPGCDMETYEAFIRKIRCCYRNRIVVHDHYRLVEKYRLRGIHLRSGQEDLYSDYTGWRVSISCHSVDEIRHLSFHPEYCFLGPVFDSISKPGYRSRFADMPDLSGIPFPVIALGGVTQEKIVLCRESGFQGVAVLGFIWEEPQEALSRFAALKTPYVMSIAGFDPSSGAGISADLKTFEATGSYGLGVCSGVTFQNEVTYQGTHWMTFEEIRQQCILQFDRHLPEYLKIGLIENFITLNLLTDWIGRTYPGIKIIWDPVLGATAGYTFHTDDSVLSDSILKRLYLITPNTVELRRLFGTEDPDMLQNIAGKYRLNILWKGGHNEGEEVTDCLICPSDISRFTVSRRRYGKHGTGCILSAAVVSALAQGKTLEEACNQAQLYVVKAIESNNSMLSFHYSTDATDCSKPIPPQLNLQYITAPKPEMSLCEQIEEVCRGGVRWVQLRIKNAGIAVILQEGHMAKEICHYYKALLIINDNVEVARQLQADGVHLGKEDMNPMEARKILGPQKIIGATCNTWDDILLRHRQGVDYIGLGPYAYTRTKEKLSPLLGLAGYTVLLEKMREAGITLPVFAIGGITDVDIPALMKTGIQGIALSGLIRDSDSLYDKTREIIRMMN